MNMRRFLPTTLLLAFPAVHAQPLPNPAGMAPDTPRMESGTPPPNHRNVQDLLFVRQAMVGGMAEVELGGIARQRGSSAGVKEFGAKMVDDHGAANERLARLARPATQPQPDPRHKALRDRLNTLSGREFDTVYMESQVAMHQQAANLLLWEMSFGQSAELAAYAAGQLPTVMAHLERARQLHAALVGQVPGR